MPEDTLRLKKKVIVQFLKVYLAQQVPVIFQKSSVANHFSSVIAFNNISILSLCGLWLPSLG